MSRWSAGWPRWPVSSSNKAMEQLEEQEQGEEEEQGEVEMEGTAVAASLRYCH